MMTIEEGFINEMRKCVKECDARCLAGFTASTIETIKDSKRIDWPTQKRLREEADQIIASFDDNCTCRERLFKMR